MKKIVAAILLTVSCLLLFGCGNPKYSPVKSTAEESEVIYTLSIDGKKYDVKYELYRALFLNYKNEIDLGDDSVWSSGNKEEYASKINEKILCKAADIYSVIHLAEKLGFAPFSNETDKEIEEYVAMSVNGNGVDVVGYGGDYDAYLESLKEMNMNYSVQVLMLRYSLMLEKINEYYLGTEDPALGMLDGEYKFTEDDVKTYYESDDCARILQGFVQRDAVEGSYEKALDLKASMESADNDINIALAIINNTTATPTELIVDSEVSGIVIGKNTVTDPIYQAYTDALFALDVGKVSDVIAVSGIEPGYFVIYKLEKSDAHLTAHYESIKTSYLNHIIGTELKNIAKSLSENADYSNKFDNLVYADISMN